MSADEFHVSWQAQHFGDMFIFALGFIRKTRRKASVLELQAVKIGGGLVRNAHCQLPTCLLSSLWLCFGVAVPMGEAAKPVIC